MGLAQVGDPLFGSGSTIAPLAAPAVGATTLLGIAQPYAAVPVYKGSSTTPFGTALADAFGVWTLPLGSPAAINDIYRTASGGVIVTAGGGTPTPDPGASGGAFDFSDPANSGQHPAL